MIVLASASPRRKELLSLITDDFIVVPSDLDETTDIKDARELVSFLAREKARDIAKRYPDSTVIGADTVVVVGDEILGKPKDTDDARRMIELLSGSTHTVLTGVCVIKNGIEKTDVCKTAVTFNEISEAELEHFFQTEEVLDKAGAYAIQGGAAKFISKIDGCYFNIVGLPVSMVYQMLSGAR